MSLWNWFFDRISRPRTSVSEPRAPRVSRHDRRGSADRTHAEASADAHNEASSKTHVAATAVLEAPSNADLAEVRSANESAAPPWWNPADATLTEPAPMERPNLSLEARALENALVSHFDGHDLSMPPLLHLAERILSGLRNPKCDLKSVAKDIAGDPVIAAAVLRMANSPLYRGLQKTTSIHAALTRLGTKAIRTLMIHESFRAAMFDKHSRQRHHAEPLWRRSLASACIMRGLSRFTGLDADEAWLIGLLHDIGNIIVLRILGTDAVFTHQEIDAATFEYLCSESHQEFGELVAEAWSLPANVTAIIRDHHTLPADDDPLRRDRLQVRLTDMINAMLGFAPPASFKLLESTAARDLGLSDRPDFAEYLAQLPAELEEVMSSL